MCASSSCFVCVLRLRALCVCFVFVLCVCALLVTTVHGGQVSKSAGNGTPLLIPSKGPATGLKEGASDQTPVNRRAMRAFADRQAAHEAAKNHSQTAAKMAQAAHAAAIAAELEVTKRELALALVEIKRMNAAGTESVRTDAGIESALEVCVMVCLEDSKLPEAESGALEQSLGQVNNVQALPCAHTKHTRKHTRASIRAQAYARKHTLSTHVQAHTRYTTRTKNIPSALITH